ncbi:LysR family transcriptional regulator [Streptomyces sp. AM 2-1-1]|uniref:LysR family transcriptional regulator n=1 Tax=unclassified Streptomyces TaxID=2593676 RepID=UPI0023B8F5D7|nr:LysR family transcriptional regulator [Streptomyces sp. AM 2-1-1]WEH38909.1 LysR family transcriptional regulator [Streptomyces sp. AM 2-1-1]
MERDEVECFLLLAEELHFGRTADRMRLSRARVSQLIQRLERRVGAPLFIRTSRRVAISAIGRQLRADLEPLHRAMDAALARAATTARGIDTTLHVGFSNPLAGEIVMKVTESLRISHPGLAVEICEVPMTDPYGRLRDGDFDVQLQEFPVREDDLGGGPPLLTEERVLAVPSAHPLAARGTVSLEDLADVLLLTIEGELPGYRQEHHAPTRTPSGRPIIPGPSVTQMQEALMLVAGGRGALLTVAHTATYFARPGVAYVPVTDAEPTGYGLVWRAGNTTGALKAFADAARAAAQEMAQRDPRAAAPV